MVQEQLFILMVNTVSLVFAATNLILLLAILMTITSIAESPRAWTYLTFGLSMIVVQFSLQVFMWTNQSFHFYGMQVLAATVSMVGFGALFMGIHDVWEVLRHG